MSSAKSGSRTRRSAKKAATKRERYVINCDDPVNDGIMDLSSLEKYLNDRIKVDGKTGNLTNRVRVSKDKDSRIVVVAVAPFSKRQLKYLVKKFLKKQGLREWLRVVADRKGSYTLRYFSINTGDDEEEK
eukprot:TRINITY_DN46381_c0_g1_i1.p2 TRINITY_DN46381_c0_g1~~TRINITY_DN46381_c0_g1_i1.p2  ORF type:complete len:130 (-),score=31.63 TRINITY_DN46381_c0_g1_i1:16-405(-)